MRWSFTVGSFRGTDVRIHVTLLLFLAWIALSAYGRGGQEAALEAVVFVTAIFACIVLHEFGHILTARQFGISSPEVTLLPIGGVADMSSMPEKPYQEFLIAVAGPAVNVVIAGVLLLAAGAFDLADALHFSDPSVRMVEKLAVTNLFLAGFNMLPAFPMDGGRVLRAALAFFMGQNRATRIAVQIGQILAIVFAIIGINGHPMLLLIAGFIYLAGTGEAQMTIMSEAARDIVAGEAMETRIAMIPRDATIAEAVATLLATSQDDFPIIDQEGRAQGLLSRNDIIEGLRQAEPHMPIAGFGQREFPTVPAQERIGAALPILNGGSPVGVVDVDGRLVGLLTRQTLSEIMMIRDVRPDWPFGRPAPTA